MASLSRRMVILGGSGALAACVTAPLSGRPELVDAYSGERQDRLHPAGFPLLAIYRRRGRVLGFMAAEHSTDPESSTFRMILQAFDHVQPAVLVMEGFPTAWGASPATIARQLAQPATSDADSWRRGEAMFAAGLAAKRGLPFRGGEPTDTELLDGLVAQGFTPDDVFFSSLFGPLDQDRRAGAFSGVTDPRFEAAYARWAAIISKNTGRASTPDLLAFKAWYERTFGVALEHDPEWHARGGPGSAGRAGEIGRANNLLRDRHLFETIMRLLNEHGRVLVVYGGSHLSSLDRAFAAALGGPEIAAAR